MVKLATYHFISHIDRILQFSQASIFSFMSFILKVSLYSFSFHAFIEFAADRVGSMGHRVG